MQNQEIKNILTNVLKPYARNARTHSKKQIRQIARSIKAFGFLNPVLIDSEHMVIAGHGRVEAAKELGLESIPTLCIEHLTESEKQAYILADNKLAQKAGWDQELLKIELQNLINNDIEFDLTLTGFETPEIDIILHVGDNPPTNQDELLEMANIPSRVRNGELWRLGKHYVYCGDALQEESFEVLMQGGKADMVFTDPPYNVPVDKHVCGSGKITHSEFAFASGEMSADQFTVFLQSSFSHLAKYSADGSIHFVCMDWRHVAEITSAAKAAYSETKNICVWNKQLGGMGSLYRSQHELIFVFKNGNNAHTNNIELGKHGRYRTNIWDYPGVHASNCHRSDLKLHPTVKPIQMVADAILDCSKQGGIILDCFAGSGSTLLAAERTSRQARLIEYEPKYCDVILHRYEKATGIKPICLTEAGHA